MMLFRAFRAALAGRRTKNGAPFDENSFDENSFDEGISEEGSFDENEDVDLEPQDEALVIALARQLGVGRGDDDAVWVTRDHDALIAVIDDIPFYVDEGTPALWAHGDIAELADLGLVAVADPANGRQRWRIATPAALSAYLYWWHEDKSNPRWQAATVAKMLGPVSAAVPRCESCGQLLDSDA